MSSVCEKIDLLNLESASGTGTTRSVQNPQTSDCPSSRVIGDGQKSISAVEISDIRLSAAGEEK
jgi:hypothetical protein